MMTSFINLSFSKQADQLSTTPTDAPLVTIQKTGPLKYKLCALFYVPSSTEDLHLQPPTENARVKQRRGKYMQEGL